jgi:NAD(P)-dependent dehydrogenase (short-subunit alcohol dehydrogenase family)
MCRGQIGLAGAAAYGATKATLVAMTRSWAAEFSPSGVRVNAIAAGPSFRLCIRNRSTKRGIPDTIATVSNTKSRWT